MPAKKISEQRGIYNCIKREVWHYEKRCEEDHRGSAGDHDRNAGKRRGSSASPVRQTGRCHESTQNGAQHPHGRAYPGPRKEGCFLQAREGPYRKGEAVLSSGTFTLLLPFTCGHRTRRPGGRVFADKKRRVQPSAFV